MQVTGTVTVGEAAAAAGGIRKRISGPVWPLYAIMFGLMFGLMTLGAAIGGIVKAVFAPDFPSDVPAYLGLAGGWLAYLLLSPAIGRWRAQRGFKARGLPIQLPAEIALEPTRIVSRCCGVETAADFAAISDVFRAGAYWIFVAQASAIIVPRRFFATEADERAFIAAALERIGASARARSPDAERFARAA